LLFYKQQHATVLNTKTVKTQMQQHIKLCKLHIIGYEMPTRVQRLSLKAYS